MTDFFFFLSKFIHFPTVGPIYADTNFETWSETFVKSSQNRSSHFLKCLFLLPINMAYFMLFGNLGRLIKRTYNIDLWITGIMKNKSV